jgi:hypothetical protein
MRCATCQDCRHLIIRPDRLEQAIPGLNILSSAYGSVRDETGLCQRHDQFTTARSTCAEFEPGPSLEQRTDIPRPAVQATRST